jgi:hypothetical protein
MCPSCKDLNTEFQIKLPSDLRKAIAVTRDNLADGTISDVTTGEIANRSVNWSLRASGMMCCYITSNATLAVNYSNSPRKRITARAAGGSQ